MTLELSHLSRRFTDFAALDDVSLSIAPGEFLALLGPSGSGKTTLLRILAGLDYPDSGSVDLDGQNFLAAPARERKIGLVFQHYALFRHLTVAENVAFGLRVRKRRLRPSKKAIAERVEQLLQRVQLDGFGHRYPTQLSGGQRQRVALARALAVEPSLLLLDEPFGALDAQVRLTLRRWLRELHEDLELTTIFVTHDQEEALELADRVAVMNRGRIEQVGTPEAIYQQPATPFVCEFIGKVNKLPLTLSGGRLGMGEWLLDGEPWNGEHAHAVAYVRPEHLALDVPETQPAWSARLRHVYLAGSVAHLELYVPSLDHTLEADIAGEDVAKLGLQPGAQLRVAPRSAVVFAMDKSGEDAAVQGRWVWQAKNAPHA
ncbi:sulfate transport system ATP-binding protein [Rhodanobacter sp. ANJX3]|uniref:sulfate/molybdate ABC transporter ATP-binding protein n=1 Tax=unclassified Rhodanobacter TaxID=2621553 RepID=UPI0015CD987C|nr:MULTISPECIES: TOBE-like domain-containing protein [unclassified Rhodanobacter]MBB5358024.1 sulfate transport system ATP-binding protein [Rhodanobacter sp. ANJX3]NYE29709.1 sulfate transport system ATP-binding protein [Rhodanobacter sp. K2T2]